MSGVNTTTDARNALRATIREWYGQNIKGEMWLTKSPDGSPPKKGLGSGDAINWLKSLDYASAKMVGKGYSMAEITRSEASTAREAKLSESIALLVTKASGERRVQSRRWRRNLALYIGAGAAAGLAIAFSTSRPARRDDW